MLEKFLDLIKQFFEQILSYVREAGTMFGFQRNRKREKVDVMVPLFSVNYDQDEVYLNQGNHEIQISTHRKPIKVWFCFDDGDGLPVCQGDIDRVGVTMLEMGFILYAKIASNCRCIRWFAVME